MHRELAGPAADLDQVSRAHDDRRDQAARAPATTAAPATDPAAHTVGMVNCPAVTAAIPSASGVARTASTAMTTSTATRARGRRRTTRSPSDQASITPRARPATQGRTMVSARCHASSPA